LFRAGTIAELRIPAVTGHGFSHAENYMHERLQALPRGDSHVGNALLISCSSQRLNRLLKNFK